LHLLSSPEDHFIDFPHIGQSDIFNIGFDFKLPFFGNFCKLFLGKLIFKGILFLNNHFLFITDIISFSLFYTWEQTFREGKLKVFGMLINLKGMIDFLNQIVCFFEEWLRKLELIIFALAKKLKQI